MKSEVSITVCSWFDKELKNAKRVVSISVTEPMGKKYDCKIEEFVPPFDIVSKIKNKKITEEEYKDIYLLKVARNIDVAISKLQDGDWLCCWESRGKFCHRLIVANLLEERGFKVTVR